MQQNDSCTTWATITNVKLARYTDINNVIDITHNCMQQRFFQETVDDVNNINRNFVNKQACNILREQIFNRQNTLQITEKNRELILNLNSNQSQQQSIQQPQYQNQIMQNTQNQPQRINRGQHIGINPDEQIILDAILDNISNNKNSKIDAINLEKQVKQQEHCDKKLKQQK